MIGNRVLCKPELCNRWTMPAYRNARGELWGVVQKREFWGSVGEVYVVEFAPDVSSSYTPAQLAQWNTETTYEQLPLFVD